MIEIAVGVFIVGMGFSRGRDAWSVIRTGIRTVALCIVGTVAVMVAVSAFIFAAAMLEAQSNVHAEKAKAEKTARGKACIDQRLAEYRVQHPGTPKEFTLFL